MLMGGADMKRSMWIIAGIFLLSWGMAVGAESGPASQPQVAERIKIQEARVPQIEAFAAQDRQQAEQWYQTRRAAVVQDITRSEAARFTLAQRELWVGYAGHYLGRPYAAEYLSPTFITSTSVAVLDEAMYEEYLISQMADVLASGEFEQKLEQVIQERLEVRTPDGGYGVWQPPSYLPVLQRQAQELLIVVKRVRTQLAIEVTQLENQKNARLEAIMEWENRLKEQVRDILEYLRQSESRPVRFGAVASVGHCVDSGYYCMIEGVDKVLAVGDTVDGVRVVKIDPEKVEFAKDGTSWTQPLGAPPQPFWGRTE
jgi:hypothetical protein